MLRNLQKKIVLDCGEMVVKMKKIHILKGVVKLILISYETFSGGVD